MAIVTLGIYILFPMIGVIFSIILYFLDDKKNSLFYSLLIGLTLGIIAYYFIPPQNYDLYRHHLITYKYIGKNWDYFIFSLKTIDAEFLPLIISYIISWSNNVNLLQLIVVTTGYTIIFYIMHDYKKENNLNSIIFLTIVMFTFFGFNALNFISGLWNYIAIIIFALALYFDYIKQYNKTLCFVLYLITLLLHNSMFFPLAIVLIYKCFKNKLNIKSFIITILICIFPTTILSIINSVVNIEIFKTIEQLYNTYLIKNEYMYNFYGGSVLFIEISKLLVILICIFMQKEKNKYSGISGLIILMSICIVLMLPQSIVMIRFIMLIQFIGIIPLTNNLKKITRTKLILLWIMIILLGFYILYFYKLFVNQNFGTLFSDGLIKNIITIFRK